MAAFRALLFAQAYCHNFHKAAFIFAPESRVGFNSTAKYDAVGFICVLVDSNFQFFGSLVAYRRMAYNYGFHRRLYRASYAFFSNSERGKYFKLAFCRSSSMTAHGRYHKGICALDFAEIGDGFYYNRNIAYASAAAGYAYIHSRFYF